MSNDLSSPPLPEPPPPLVGPLGGMLLKTSLLALLTLVLWGRGTLHQIWLIVGLVIGLRLIWLLKAWVEGRRSRLEIGIEALSLLIVVPCALLLALMLTATIVEFSGPADWPVFASLAAALALHFGPSLARSSPTRIYYRTVIAVVMLAVTAGVLRARHPYLIASGIDKRRILAEKVWDMGVTFKAGYHAGKLYAYAEDLVAEGSLADAVLLYERGLVVDVHNHDARQRLADLSQQLGRISAPIEIPLEHTSTALWVKSDDVKPVAVMPDPVPLGFFIVLVPAGNVPDIILNRVAAEVTARNELPVYRYPVPLTLPPPDRSHGLIGERQWSVETLWELFLQTKPGEKHCQYIIVSAGDIFTPDTNFVFGTAAGHHGMVSYARFASPNRNPTTDDLLIDRLAKQVMSTSIKAFGLFSTTTDCVTTTCINLEQFDLKSQTACPAVRRQYLRAINDWVAQHP